ncbi:MAG: ATP-binding cassette domain-containing protein [Xanthomonadales bacterium]|nr:ATP-binding cassette domain-containing protein [Xanthomonadales bacterium]
MTDAPPPLIELDRATVMRGARTVLDEVSLRIEAGEHTAILGPNGCGKSSFVRLITRELYAVARRPPDTPPVRLFGAARWDVFALRQRLGVVSNDLQRDFAGAPAMRAEDAVVCGFFSSQRIPDHLDVEAWMRARAREALAEVDALDLAARLVPSLSSGEARRVLIARALVHRPQALLLDEPTTGLDVVARGHFLAMLGALAERGVTLALVTHHLEEVIPAIRRVVLLRSGRVFADGTPEDVLTSATLSAQYGADLVVRTEGHRRVLEPYP